MWCVAVAYIRRRLHLDLVTIGKAARREKVMSLQTAPRAAATADDAPEIPLAAAPDSLAVAAEGLRAPGTHRRERRRLADSTKASLTYADTFLRAVVLSRVLKRLVGPGDLRRPARPADGPHGRRQHRAAPAGKGADQPELHGQPGAGRFVDRPVRHHARPDLGEGPRQVQDPAQGDADLSWRTCPRRLAWPTSSGPRRCAKLVPIAALGAFLPGLRGDHLDATATVIFTSGSTGDPKGVVLSHRNVLSNIHQIEQHSQLLPDEVVLGILPFFHSFGFTVTIWTVLCLGKRVVYHINPLDAKIIGDLCEKHGVDDARRPRRPTCGPTSRAASPKQFATLVHLILGAEKLKPELAEEIQREARDRADGGLRLHRAVAGGRGQHDCTR